MHAKRCGIALRQSFAKEGKALKRKAGGYAHAKQFNRLKRTVKRQRTIGKLKTAKAGDIDSYLNTFGLHRPLVNHPESPEEWHIEAKD